MTPERTAPELEGASVVLSEAGFRDVYGAWKRRIREVLRASEHWAIVGVKRRGSILARRLWEEFRRDLGALDFGDVDISLYRDDYHLQLSQPRVLGTEIAFGVDGCRILLVDDVLYTGRTIRAALDLILDFGRPRRVLLAVLADRGHRELPIAPDITGIEIPTAREDHVMVRLREMDGVDQVLVVREDASGSG
jgi:pyrimidine operon attenuation protein/uracil phosphoribosyltransferase